MPVNGKGNNSQVSSFQPERTLCSVEWGYVFCRLKQ